MDHGDLPRARLVEFLRPLLRRCVQLEPLAHGIAEGDGPRRGKDAYAGPAVTVSCQQDSSLVAELVEAPGAGRVLVVEDAEAPRRPLLAGAMARRAAHNGWAGVIVQGTVRDVEVLRSTDLGVHALAPSPVAPQHGGTGAMGVPVTVAGVTIHAGDHVYADANGIVVTEGPCD